ncbi:MAG: hypothetical protein GY778_13545 [bacterium]|nr:hypothetical protein [bacterium]
MKRANAKTPKRRKKTRPSKLSYIEASIRHLAVPVAELKPDAGNLRTHSERNLEVIRRSLADFRQQTPIVRDADGVVRKGNGTLEAAIALGWSHVAVVDSSLRGKAAELYAVADNRSGDPDVGSAWAEEALAQFLSDLDEDPATDVEAAGFTPDEVQGLIAASVAELEEADRKQATEAFSIDGPPGGEHFALPMTRSVAVRLTEAQYQTVKARAVKLGIGVADLIRQALGAYFEQKGKRQEATRQRGSEN